MTNIAATTAYQARSQGQQKKTGAARELGKDAFLQLMVTQMRYQDPLSPQDNSAFLAQLAQFSALEQMQNLNSTVEKLLALQGAARNLAPAYLGLVVTALDQNGQQVEGEVTAVEFAGGQTRLVINGKNCALEDVLKVTTGGEA
ncbi:MAG TPA: flagellar hook capping protein [Firmicutes bacterium]|nr:flagellar hook capping protein [Bacillota bacterium]